MARAGLPARVCWVQAEVLRGSQLQGGGAGWAGRWGDLGLGASPWASAGARARAVLWKCHCRRLLLVSGHCEPSSHVTEHAVLH